MSEPASRPEVSDLTLAERMTIRFSATQIDRAARAAQIVSRQRGQLVDPGALVREMSMAGIDQILAEAGEAVPT